MQYNDQQCVAALNSCLDLKKWNALPYDVQQRVKNLFCAYRIKAVCFFDDMGFGLKVYRDAMNVKSDGGDEVESILDEVSGKDKKPHTVDPEGAWLRCPAVLYQQVDPYLVIDEYGRKYYQEIISEDPEEDGFGDCDLTEVDGEENTYWKWNSSRGNAKVMSLGEAQLVASRIPGSMVVKSDRNRR